MIHQWFGDAGSRHTCPVYFCRNCKVQRRLRMRLGLTRGTRGRVVDVEEFSLDGGKTWKPMKPRPKCEGVAK